MATSYSRLIHQWSWVSFGILIGATSVICYRKYAEKALKLSKKDVIVKSNKEAKSEPDELMKEQLSRIEAFFGPNSFEKIKDSFVIVVGLGGVGSHAAHMLARSGVGKLRLIDFDNVTLSSLNRHAVATRADVGRSKVEATKRHLLETVPGCKIEALPVMFDANGAESLLEGNPTFVLDCIDDCKTKVDLLYHANTRDLMIMTATGAGAKADPTRLCIGDLNDATTDALAGKIRYMLKKKGVDPSKILSMYSSEKSRCDLLPLNKSQAEDPGAFGNVEHFRLRVIPVLGTTPAIFGQGMAAHILTVIAGQPIKPECVPRLSKERRNKLYNHFQNRENKISKDAGKKPIKISIDPCELEFIVRDIWRTRSSVSCTQGGFTNERLNLVWWRRDLPLCASNIVLLTNRELKQMDESGIEVFGNETVSRIDARLKEFCVYEY